MPAPWSPHGIVFPGKMSADMAVERVEMAPHPSLSPYIWSYWTMTWDLPPGVSLPVLAVPSGTFNYYFDRACPMEPMRARVLGVRQTSFEFALSGKGGVAGVRFAAGGYSIFHAGPLAPLVDGALSLAKVEPTIADATVQALLAAPTLAALKALLDPLFLARLPAAMHADLGLLQRFFAFLGANSGPLTVRDVATALATNERQLQRVFERRVGVSPKSILRTRRFQAVADLLMAGGTVDWAQFALEMGYYDQPHLLNDFRAMTGWLPRELSDFSKKPPPPFVIQKAEPALSTKG